MAKHDDQLMRKLFDECSRSLEHGSMDEMLVALEKVIFALQSVQDYRRVLQGLDVVFMKKILLGLCSALSVPVLLMDDSI